jgi:type I restriction-modification system DNA methylase subunit/predicted type IV restriction endonuclease
MGKEEVVKKLRGLVDDFKARYSHYKSLSEADIESKLVESLFVNILGWAKEDFYKQQPAKRGDKRGRADYAFKIGEKTSFFLEVKRVGVPLDKEADKQVVSYALSKRVSFAISTNFEQMKIFCVEENNAVNNVFRVFTDPEEYVTKINDLLLLSRESFEKNELMLQAEAEGRLKRRSAIDKVLLEDLMEVRRLIAYDLEKRYPSKYGINEQDEIVQRIIDRLIFIRRAEDIGIQPDDLRLEDIKHLSGDKAYSRLKDIFRQYDGAYDGGLFDPNYDNDCDKITIDGEITKKLIYLLYESKDKQYIYDFDWIDADVLGQVYEQYLGKILAQTKSGRAKLKDGQAHKKEQGIYYTPTYIVDYIVKNTVGELLKDKKVDPTRIKILDPACGSGSFLIKAYDYLANHIISSGGGSKQHRLDEQGHYSVKTEILKNNLFGVDLDQKAVEITKLNLLLKAAEKNRKLPKEVDMHIRHGNSLIDNNTKDPFAFKWIGDFEEKTFDAVIGNPPYINAIQLTKTVGADVKEYWKEKYESAKGTYDIYVLFFEQSLRVCKEGGYVAFITPNKYLSSPYGVALREFISKNYKLVKILDLSSVKVFEDPSVYPIVTIIQKVKMTKKYTITTEKMFSENQSDKRVCHVSSDNLTKLPESIWGIILSNNLSLVQKIFGKGRPLETVAEVQATSTAAEADEYSKHIDDGKKGMPIINTGTIDRYGTTYGTTKFMNKGTQLKTPVLDTSKVSDNRRKLYESKKIIIAKLALRIEGFVDEKGEYSSINTNCVHSPKEGYSIEFLAGLINSKLISFIYSELFSGLRMSGGYFQFQAPQLRILPIATPSKDHKEKIEALVRQIISLNKQLVKFGDKNTSETAKLKEEIEKTDAEIDDLVYQIYGITDKERKIIEESLK